MDFNRRLNSLRQRRAFTDIASTGVALDSVNLSLSKSLNESFESYDTLKESSGIKYVVGAMAPVSKRGTEISKSEGQRVANSLIKSLEAQNENVTSVLQGSVALNIHIKGASDVDMLIIERDTLFVERPHVSSSAYVAASDSRSLLQIVKDIRNKSESILSENFPAVNVIGNDKSIAMDGGSLRVPVDIVPAVWFDNIYYQRTRDQSDRGIKIYSKSDDAFITNFPFKHIEEVNLKDSRYSGNVKCVIRLLKTLVSDMDETDKKVAKGLSSYDLTALAYHMEDNLDVPVYQRVALVLRIEAFFTFLIGAPEYRNSLSVPNGTRKIFDAPERLPALILIRDEVRELSFSIAKEIEPWNSNIDTGILERRIVADTVFDQ
ncbi:nucleotidyltransferase family protein [Pseudomonas alliivorans]